MPPSRFKCNSLRGKAMFFREKLTQRDSLSRVNTLLYTSVSYFSVDVQIRDESCLSDPRRVTDTPSFFHWQAVCLFVVMSLFLFNHSGCFFVSFYRQHASTNATMVFKANCDVHYFHCCLILFGLISSTHRLAS